MKDITKTLENTYAYNGSAVDLDGTMLASSFTEQPPGELEVHDADNARDWDSEEIASWNGENATYLGSGTATSAVTLHFGFFKSFSFELSSPVDVVSWEAGGQVYVNYPDGDQAELLDGLVSQIENSDLLQHFNLHAVLRALHVSSLTEYVEKNAVLNFDLDFNSSYDIPVCFARGTLIETVAGPVPVEALMVGDLVITEDDGAQPIRWIGRRRVEAKGAFAPVRIARGALGNSSDLIVSQQHRILLRDWRASLMFGESEVLVPARHLLNDTTIHLAPCGKVEYFHLLFDRHQILTSNGLSTESFHPGDVALGAITHAAKSEVLRLFPELGCQGWSSYGPVSRRSLRRYEAKALVTGR